MRLRGSNIDGRACRLAGDSLPYKSRPSRCERRAMHARAHVRRKSSPSRDDSSVADIACCCGRPVQSIYKNIAEFSRWRDNTWSAALRHPHPAGRNRPHSDSLSKLGQFARAFRAMAILPSPAARPSAIHIDSCDLLFGAAPAAPLHPAGKCPGQLADTTPSFIRCSACRAPVESLRAGNWDSSLENRSFPDTRRRCLRNCWT